MSKILTIALNPAIDISSDAETVRHTHKTRTHNQQQFPGGGGVNVSRVISELGGRSELVFLSGGATGQLLEAMLKPLAIDARPVRIHDPVRIAYAVHETSTNLEYRFVPEGPLVTDEELAPVFEIIRDAQAQYIVASGSLPRGVANDSYVKIAEIARETGSKLILDTSGDALTTTLDRGQVFLVKPSLGEIESCLGLKLDHDSVGPAAQEIVRRGSAKHIAVSLGGDGAILVSEDRIIRAPAIPVAVQSAVGAGDSFVAGMTWSLAAGHGIEVAFRFGMAAGAAAVMTAGTELCRRQDVFDLYRASQP